MNFSTQQIQAAKLLGQGWTQQEVAQKIGGSRRSVSRWLQDPAFKNLCFGMSSSGAAPTPQKPQKPQLEVQHQPEAATIEDLLPLAIQTLQEILGDSEIRVSDRLKAIQIIFNCGVGRDVEELEALRLLITSGWLPPEMLSPAGKAVRALKDTMRELFGEVKPRLGSKD